LILIDLLRVMVPRAVVTNIPVTILIQISLIRVGDPRAVVLVITQLIFIIIQDTNPP